MTDFIIEGRSNVFKELFIVRGGRDVIRTFESLKRSLTLKRATEVFV